MTPRTVTRRSLWVAGVCAAGAVALIVPALLGWITLNDPQAYLYLTLVGVAAVAVAVGVAVGSQTSVDEAFTAGATMGGRAHLVTAHHVHTSRRRLWPRMLIVGLVTPTLAILPWALYQSTASDRRAAVQAQDALAGQVPSNTSSPRCQRLIDNVLREVTCEPLKSDQPDPGQTRCWLWIRATGSTTLASIPCGISRWDLEDQYPHLYERAQQPVEQVRRRDR